jgi:hypothetical protein
MVVLFLVLVVLAVLNLAGPAMVFLLLFMGALLIKISRIPPRDYFHTVAGVGFITFAIVFGGILIL